MAQSGLRSAIERLEHRVFMHAATNDYFFAMHH